MIIIEIGGKCTIHPDNNLIYEIIDVKSKDLVIRLGKTTETVTNYFVDLKRLDKPNEKFSNIPVAFITTIDNG
jgi:hypothetical protein